MGRPWLMHSITVFAPRPRRRARGVGAAAHSRHAGHDRGVHRRVERVDLRGHHFEDGVLYPPLVPARISKASCQRPRTLRARRHPARIVVCRDRVAAHGQGGSGQSLTDVVGGEEGDLVPIAVEALRDAENRIEMSCFGEDYEEDPMH